MNTEFVNLGLSPIAVRWWALVLRGIAALAFGVLALVTLRLSLLASINLFGAYALVDGICGILLAARGARVGVSWGWLLLEGVVGALVGMFTLVVPGITAALLLTLIAAWALVTGVMEIAAAIRLRRLMLGERLLATCGAISIALSVLLFLFPAAGTLPRFWLISAYAVVFGALLIALGLRLHRWHLQEQGMAANDGAPLPG